MRLDCSKNSDDYKQSDCIKARNHKIGDIAQDLPVLTDMHVPILACMLDVLQLLVLDFCQFLQVLVLFTLHRFAITHCFSE